jgi:hypothetical protein
VRVYASADATDAAQTLESPDAYGSARSFLVLEQGEHRLRVQLPVRPNGSEGWVDRDDVMLVRPSYEVRMELGAKRLTVRRHGRVVLRTVAGIGSPATPTPTGRYFVTNLVRVTDDPEGYYGGFAVGLSAHSEVLDSFRGGPPQVAIHGTNDPASIGGERSNGCLHVANDVAQKLEEMLELGTPVTLDP